LYEDLIFVITTVIFVPKLLNFNWQVHRIWTSFILFMASNSVWWMYKNSFWIYSKWYCLGHKRASVLMDLLGMVLH